MPGIGDFSTVTLNNDQQVAAELLETFLGSDAADVFLLKGHAGTGKTMLIQAVIKYLQVLERPVVLLASTGRAAKIVAEKAKYGAETVHKGIYVLELEDTDDENKIRRLKFRLKPCGYPEKTIFIVDESSMISDTNMGGKFIDFGTGKLLTDLFTYIGTRKVIFSGDQCQLPPIQALVSPCLDASYLRNVHHKTVSETILTEVMRYRKESGIYQNTDKLRGCIEQKIFHKFQIFVSQHKDHHLHYTEEKLVDSYVNKVGKVGIDNVIMIVFKNATAAELNKMIRMKLFPRHRFLVKNELLLIVQNNYKFDVANGEHLIVDQVAKEKEQRANLTFLTISGRVKDELGYRTIKGKLIEDLLYSPLPSMSGEQEYELYKDFAIRMKRKGVKATNPEFLAEMLYDPYLNALRAKFGYAVTCHKSQGGEWDEVYLVIENALFHPDGRENLFRWTYTAISRGVKHVHFLDNHCII